jgi:hypothetical protein
MNPVVHAEAGIRPNQACSRDTPRQQKSEDLAVKKIAGRAGIFVQIDRDLLC